MTNLRNVKRKLGDARFGVKGQTSQWTGWVFHGKVTTERSVREGITGRDLCHSVGITRGWSLDANRTFPFEKFLFVTYIHFSQRLLPGFDYYCNNCITMLTWAWNCNKRLWLFKSTCQYSNERIYFSVGLMMY